MKILLAVRESEKSVIVSVLQRLEFQLFVLDRLSSFSKIPKDIRFALIDEDFDGPQTGWNLSQNIREAGYSTKIVMIVRKNPTHNLIPFYDVTLGFPISEEALIGEIRRQWPIT